MRLLAVIGGEHMDAKIWNCVKQKEKKLFLVSELTIHLNKNVKNSRNVHSLTRHPTRSWLSVYIHQAKKTLQLNISSPHKDCVCVFVLL